MLIWLRGTIQKVVSLSLKHSISPSMLEGLLYYFSVCLEEVRKALKNLSCRQDWFPRYDAHGTCFHSVKPLQLRTETCHISDIAASVKL